MIELIERAAAARREQMRAVGDRPRERRCAEIAGAVTANRSVARRPVEVRAASEGDGLSFTGYASVTETPYEMYDMFGAYNEVVSRGAFESSLNLANLDVPLVLNHDSLRRIARTTNGSLALAEDETGLRADAPNLDPGDADVAYIAPKLRSGLIDEMSFRFSITAGQWSPDYTEFRINEADIQRGDVSIVGYGASPHTSAQLRAALEQLEVKPPASIRALLFGEHAVADLSRADVAELRELDLAVRKELAGRGLAPSMSFLDILSA